MTVLRSVLAAAWLAVALLPRQADAQFVPELTYWSLDEINAYWAPTEEWPAPPIPAPFTLNTPESKLRLLGEYQSNYIQSFGSVVDSTRGLLYVPEVVYGSSSSFGTGGTIAVIDLKTLGVMRRITVEHEGQTVTPGDLAIDPVGNRLFVSDFNARRLYAVDAVSGSVLFAYSVPYKFLAYPYSRTTNRLYITNYETDRFAIAALDLGDLNAEPVPLQKPPAAEDDIESYFVVNDDEKIAYWGFAKAGLIFAYDIDPASQTFHQIIWTTGGSTMPEDHPRQWLQPSLDRVRGRLFVPDPANSVIRVFDARRGPTLHAPLAPISLAGHSPSPTFSVSEPRAMVTAEADQVTGLVYVLITGWDEVTGKVAKVLTVHPTEGVVAAAPLPPVTAGAGAGQLFLEPSTRRVMVSTGWMGYSVAVFDDLRESVLDTPSGSEPVEVVAPEMTLTFSSVLAPGTTTITPLQQAPSPLPGSFSLGGALFYELTTTASFSGVVTLCLSAAHVDDPASFSALSVLHYVNGWQDLPIESRDFETRTICARTSSFSPFALARLTTPTFSARVLHSTDRAFKRGATAPLKVQILNWSGANVSSAASPLKIVSIQRVSDDAALAVEDAGHSNPDQTFRFDASVEGYVFNLSTKGFAAGSYSVTVDVGGSGQYLQVPFSLR